jgi:hypothetical protein
VKGVCVCVRERERERDCVCVYGRQITNFHQQKFSGGNLIASILTNMFGTICSHSKLLADPRHEQYRLFTSIPRLLKSVCGANAGQKRGESFYANSTRSFVFFSCSETNLDADIFLGTRLHEHLNYLRFTAKDNQTDGK